MLHSPCNCIPQHPRMVGISSKERTKWVHLNEIVYLMADGPLTHVHCMKGVKYVSSKNLGHYVKELPLCFAQPNQKYLVNLFYVDCIEKGGWLKMLHAKHDAMNITNAFRESFWQRFDHWNTSQSPPLVAPSPEPQEPPQDTPQDTPQDPTPETDVTPNP